MDTQDLRILIEKIAVPLTVLIASDTHKPIADISPGLRKQLQEANQYLLDLAKNHPEEEDE